MNKTYGFIILRHINDKNFDIYWKLCYKNIRKFYPENQILIIDDNSNNDFIDLDYQNSLYKTNIINSSYIKRGELLPYYYFLYNKLFDNVVIIHDSVFINKYIDFNIDKYQILWEFEHKWDNSIKEINMIKKLDNHIELLEFYNNKKLWKGCFGGMSIISHDYLTEINKKYNLELLLPIIISRTDRMSFERVISCILQKEKVNKSLFGNIHKYCKWGIKYENIDFINNNLPFIKVWSGR